MSAPKGNKNAIGNNGGADKIGLDILWDGWYNDILDLFREGASDKEVRAFIVEKTLGATKCSYTLWDRWMEEEIEFSETIKTGRILSEGLFHKMGRLNLENKEFNYTGWYMQMKNRFGWMDKQHTDITSGGEKLIFTPIDLDVKE
jgi:hypothetical protein